MARKPQSFKLDNNKKVIILYTNVRIEAENDLINFYLDRGYTPMYAEKKPSITVADMRKEMKGDEESLKAFNDAYEKKNGFFEACKVYSEWKKAHKT